MFTIPALPAPNALADPAFLASAAGESWVGALAENFPHTRYWRDRSDCWSLKPQCAGREGHRCPL
jgi:hypothetical protein